MSFRYISRREKLAYFSFTLLGMMGAYAITYSTRWGAIVYSDSTAYILSARNFLAGHGFGVPMPGGSIQPLTHFPPFYPLVLAGLGYVGIDPLQGARWLNVILFAGLIICICGSVYHDSQRWALSFLLGATVLTAPLFLNIFSRAMSEALFFFLMYLCLIWLAEFLHSQHRKQLIGAGIAVGLACLTRYISLTLVLCGGLILLLAPRITWQRKLVNLGIFTGLAGGLPALWLVSVYMNTQQFAARSFQFGDGLSIALREAKVSLIDLGWSWVPFARVIEPVPTYAFRGWFLIISIGLLVTISLLSMWFKFRSTKVSLFEIDFLRLPFIFALYAIIYLLFVTLAFFFSTPRNDLDERLLSPVYLSGLIFLFLMLFRIFSDGKSGRWLSWIPVGMMVIFMISGISDSIRFLQANHQYGSGYTGEAWKNSELIKAVQLLDQDRALISNESAAILFLTGRPAYEVNERFLAAPAEKYTRFGDDSADPAQRLFKTGQAVLVIFPGTFYWQLYPIYGDRTQARLDSMLQGLTIEQRLSDGIIYRYSQP